MDDYKNWIQEIDYPDFKSYIIEREGYLATLDVHVYDRAFTARIRANKDNGDLVAGDEIDVYSAFDEDEVIAWANAFIETVEEEL